MKKLLLGLVLSVGVVMASETPKDDLLSMATMVKDDMKDADGGWSFVSISYSNYFYSSWYSRLNKW